MAYQSKIQWTEATWNPWHGCRKVSAGCKFCYMYRDKERYKQDPTTVLRSKTKFNAPLTWHEPKLIFTCSWSDWFIEEADQWRNEAWEIIKRTPQHIYQILTKRPERVEDHLPSDWGDGYDNVWLGVSVEDQKAANERLPILSKLKAKIKFISFEPLLENIILHDNPLRYHFYDIYYSDDGFGGCLKDWSFENGAEIDWAIIGGESGNESGKYQYRPCELEWIKDLMFQLEELEIPTFVKQLGTHLSKELKLKDRHGGDIDEWPESVQVREIPESILETSK